MNIPACVDYGGHWEDVDAELLPDIAPHLAGIATFAVHRGARADKHWWMVTNLETGLLVTHSIWKETAIELAANKLATKTVGQVETALTKRYREIIAKMDAHNP